MDKMYNNKGDVSMRLIEACNYAGRTTLRYKDTHEEIDNIEELEKIAQIVNQHFVINEGACYRCKKWQEDITQEDGVNGHCSVLEMATERDEACDSFDPKLN